MDFCIGLTGTVCRCGWHAQEKIFTVTDILKTFPGKGKRVLSQFHVRFPLIKRWIYLWWHLKNNFLTGLLRSKDESAASVRQANWKGLSMDNFMFVLAINICGVWDGLMPSSGAVMEIPTDAGKTPCRWSIKCSFRYICGLGKCVDGNKILNLLSFKGLREESRQKGSSWEVMGGVCVLSQTVFMDVLGEICRRTKWKKPL